MEDEVKDPPTAASQGIAFAGSYGDAWPIAGAKNLAELAMQIANRIERLGHDRTAAPINVLVEEIDLPLSTFYSLEADGKGPRTFKLGRRKYCLLTDWQAWLQLRATAED